ncbi:MAG TPA: aryl-sulfate sulfotransferase [Holosporales bacterium]|nr:aryl-sulfate sulfotransferase [Holosporales bacterium]
MSIQKRSLTLFSHRTSISLEPDFWHALNDIAKNKQLSLQKLIELIDQQRENNNLSSAIRIYVLHYFQKNI